MFLNRIIPRAKTGTGKPLAFGISIIKRLTKKARVKLIEEKRMQQQQPVSMAEHTEKAFLKHLEVFLSWNKFGKGKRHGKGGNHLWKNIDLGFKNPRDTIEGNYIDRKCPFTGTVSVNLPHYHDGSVFFDGEQGFESADAEPDTCELQTDNSLNETFLCDEYCRH